MITQDFWSGRRVLLTGHTGFKGAWMALWLRHLGAEVHGFALPPHTRPALYDLARVHEDVDSTIGDLRDAQAVRAAVERARPQLVLHLAAQPLVRRSIAEPVETLAVNVLGVAHLLEALRGSPGLLAALIVTSDKVYDNNGLGGAFAETDRLGGKDPYSASKAGAELVARCYAETFLAAHGVAVATARGGNVIGGGDYSEDRIIPDVVRSAERGERPILRMPFATRPWQHVLDCLAGYLKFAEALAMGAEPPRALNFGPDANVPITVARLAETMLVALGQEPVFGHESSSHDVEMPHLAVDARLARQTLGWSDRLPGARAIDWTARWYRALREGQDARALTLAQIEAFESLAK